MTENGRKAGTKLRRVLFRVCTSKREKVLAQNSPLHSCSLSSRSASTRFRQAFLSAFPGPLRARSCGVKPSLDQHSRASCFAARRRGSEKEGSLELRLCLRSGSCQAAFPQCTVFLAACLPTVAEDPPNRLSRNDDEVDGVEDDDAAGRIGPDSNSRTADVTRWETWRCCSEKIRLHVTDRCAAQSLAAQACES